MPLKKPSTKKPVTKKPKDGEQTSKGVQGPFKVVKKRDGNYPVKLY
jgi:hypothetical protein